MFRKGLAAFWVILAFTGSIPGMGTDCCRGAPAAVRSVLSPQVVLHDAAVQAEFTGVVPRRSSGSGVSFPVGTDWWRYARNTVVGVVVAALLAVPDPGQLMRREAEISAEDEAVQTSLQVESAGTGLYRLRILEERIQHMVELLRNRALPRPERIRYGATLDGLKRELVALHPYTVVVAGSSTAEGVGAGSPQTACIPLLKTALTERFPGISLINIARGGNTLADILPAAYAEESVDHSERWGDIVSASSYQPDVIILMLPSNDTASHVSVAQQLQGYRRIISFAQSKNISLIIVSPQPRWFSPDRTEQQHLTEVQLSVREALQHGTWGAGVAFLDVWSPLADASGEGTINPAYAYSDGVHLNDAGHRMVFKLIESVVVPRMLGLKPAEAHSAVLLPSAQATAVSL